MNRRIGIGFLIFTSLLSVGNTSYACNSDPVACIAPTEDYVCAGSTVNFDAFHSWDPDGDDIVDWEWWLYDYDLSTYTMFDDGYESTSYEFTKPGRYDVDVYVQDEHGAWSDYTTCDVYVFEIDYVTVESNATQTNVTGAKNWAAVKKSGEYVMVKAVLDPSNYQHLAPSWLVTWSGGEYVPGQPLKRKVSKSTSAKTRVTAACSTSDYVDIWILWADIEIKMSGTTPTNAVQFGSSRDGTEKLGAVSWANGTMAAGKVVAIGSITPSGVHDVVKDGWEILRYKERRCFIDGAKWTGHWDTVWNDDTSYSSWTNLTPDTNDQIFDTDAPNVGEPEEATDSHEKYANYRQWIEWNDQVASDQYTYWCWQGRWKDGATPEEITLKDVDSGSISLPDENGAYYDPP